MCSKEGGGQRNFSIFLAQTKLPTTERPSPVQENRAKCGVGGMCGKGWRARESSTVLCEVVGRVAVVPESLCVTQWEKPTGWPLQSHWSDHTHMVTPSVKGGWEM